MYQKKLQGQRPRPGDTPSVCSLRSHPHSPFCRYATSSPGRGKSALKGAAFGNAVKLPAATKAVPLGKVA